MKKENSKIYIFLLASAMVGLLSSAFKVDQSGAAIQGDCGNCHTMHNSQSNLPMNAENDFDTPGQPNDNLLQASCLGCHAQGGNALEIMGADTVPQVYHTELTKNLAGGNFYYVKNVSEAKGHNIAALTGTDSVLLYPPGGLTIRSDHYGDNSIVTTGNLTCSSQAIGQNGGCHGHRGSTDPLHVGIYGAHHDNWGNGAPVNPVNDREPGHSYRFLLGVKGYEDADWQYTKGPADHNEYYGQAVPTVLSTCSRCHGIANSVRAYTGTISQFCATCHGNFHTLATSGDDGIGDNAIGPFIRHPTDLALPSEGEYASYVNFNLDTPVARPTVYAAANATVTPGTDIVMCLSCHYSHGSEYDDMLRWDYSGMIVGSGNTGGCFTCHTTKN